jgi:Flp pilus assembly pilin Flp
MKPHPGGGGEQGGCGMKRILGYVKDEQGIETLEWLAVGALIIAVALVVYPGTLQTGLITVVNSITDKLTGILT